MEDDFDTTRYFERYANRLKSMDPVISYANLEEYRVNVAEWQLELYNQTGCSQTDIDKYHAKCLDYYGIIKSSEVLKLEAKLEKERQAERERQAKLERGEKVKSTLDPIWSSPDWINAVTSTNQEILMNPQRHHVTKWQLKQEAVLLKKSKKKIKSKEDVLDMSKDGIKVAIATLEAQKEELIAYIKETEAVMNSNEASEELKDELEDEVEDAYDEMDNIVSEIESLQHLSATNSKGGTKKLSSMGGASMKNKNKTFMKGGDTEDRLEQAAKTKKYKLSEPAIAEGEGDGGAAPKGVREEEEDPEEIEREQKRKEKKLRRQQNTTVPGAAGSGTVGEEAGGKRMVPGRKGSAPPPPPGATNNAARGGMAMGGGGRGGRGGGKAAGPGERKRQVDPRGKQGGPPPPPPSGMDGSDGTMPIPPIRVKKGTSTNKPLPPGATTPSAPPSAPLPPPSGNNVDDEEDPEEIEREKKRKEKKMKLAAAGGPSPPPSAPSPPPSGNNVDDEEDPEEIEREKKRKEKKMKLAAANGQSPPPSASGRDLPRIATAAPRSRAGQSRGGSASGQPAPPPPPSSEPVNNPTATISAPVQETTTPTDDDVTARTSSNDVQQTGSGDSAPLEEVASGLPSSTTSGGAEEPENADDAMPNDDEDRERKATRIGKKKIRSIDQYRAASPKKGEKPFSEETDNAENNDPPEEEEDREKKANRKGKKKIRSIDQYRAASPKKTEGGTAGGQEEPSQSRDVEDGNREEGGEEPEDEEERERRENRKGKKKIRSIDQYRAASPKKTEGGTAGDQEVVAELDQGQPAGDKREDDDDEGSRRKKKAAKRRSLDDYRAASPTAKDGPKEAEGSSNNVDGIDEAQREQDEQEQEDKSTIRKKAKRRSLDDYRAASPFLVRPEATTGETASGSNEVKAEAEAEEGEVILKNRKKKVEDTNNASIVGAGEKAAENLVTHSGDGASTQDPPIHLQPHLIHPATSTTAGISGPPINQGFFGPGHQIQSTRSKRRKQPPPPGSGPPPPPPPPPDAPPPLLGHEGPRAGQPPPPDGPPGARPVSQPPPPGGAPPPGMGLGNSVPGQPRPPTQPPRPNQPPPPGMPPSLALDSLALLEGEANNVADTAYSTVGSPVDGSSVEGDDKSIAAVGDVLSGDERSVKSAEEDREELEKLMEVRRQKIAKDQEIVVEKFTVGNIPSYRAKAMVAAGFGVSSSNQVEGPNWFEASLHPLQSSRAGTSLSPSQRNKSAGSQIKTASKKKLKDSSIVTANGPKRELSLSSYTTLQENRAKIKTALESRSKGPKGTDAMAYFSSDPLDRQNISVEQVTDLEAKDIESFSKAGKVAYSNSTTGGNSNVGWKASRGGTSSNHVRFPAIHTV